MDEERFNIEIRKFLKLVGVTSQREIEGAVRKALTAKKIAPDAELKAKVSLSVPELGLTREIQGTISLE